MKFILALALFTAACTQIRGADSCELSALSTDVATGSGAAATDVTIGGEILSAVLSGGQTLPALLTTLEATFGAQTVACAAQAVDSLVASITSGAAPAPSAVAATYDQATALAGLSALRNEEVRRGYMHPAIPMSR